MAPETNVVEFPTNEVGQDQRQSSEKLQPVADTPPLETNPNKPEISLALGGGAARGWAHIGVMRAIDEANIPVSMIAGTSIGALVGGCYLAGKLDELEEFARSITRANILRYMDFALRASGLISGTRLADRMDGDIGHLNIEDLDRRFVAIATDIRTGSEIWIENGPLIEAIRASYALPGVFEPVTHLNRQLVDGALVNPVPVSACRAFEQKIVVAVNLSSEVLGRSSVVRSGSIEPSIVQSDIGLPEQPAGWFPFARGKSSKKSHDRMGVAGVMIEAFNIIQDRIIRSRMAGDPPDMVIRPKLTGIGLSDFHKADRAIEYGYETARLKIIALEEAGFISSY